ncbi:MAG: DUF11 domain-containing protein, partial [Caldiserica bacterium]|nr:DUF11 domain-containing protein [Caldisericota bacterium]
TTVFVGALLYGEGFSVAADDPATASVLDPLVMTVREEVGGAAALYPGRGEFTKEATADTGSPSRLVSPGDTVEFRISYTAADGGTVELVDPVPPPLRLIPGTPSAGEAEAVGELTLVRARFAGLAPSDRVSLRYRAEVRGMGTFPFLATRALAVLPSGEVIFSDDPGTEAPGDPTALLFPWIYGDWSPGLWEEFSRRARCVLPVIVRVAEGREELRWAHWGPGSAGPGDLVFAGLLEVPLPSLAWDADLGFLLVRAPGGSREAYVPGVYGAPIFVPLSDGVGFVESLKGPFCGNIRLPLVVRWPWEGPVYLTGVVVDEGT